GGCQFFGKRLISWQCKKQTIIVNSTTEAEYVVAANCCGHVLWIQNQMLDYEFNFMNTKIYIDNENAEVTLVTPTQVSNQREAQSQESQPKDQLRVFSAAKVLADTTKVHTYTRRRRAISTASGGISTAEESVSTVGTSMPVSTAGMVKEVSIPSPVATKDKGKAIMQEHEQTTTKLQQRQERAGYEAAIRLQDQLDEEERQRIARVHKEASSFNVEEWENIQATIEADEELALRIQAEEREKYSKAEKARLLAQQRTYMSNYVKHMESHTLQQLKRLFFDELKNLFEAIIKRVKTFTPMESDFDRTISKIADESLKRAAEEELKQESSKRQKTRESSEPREKEDDELTQEDLQQMIMMVPVKEIYVEALHVKYPIIDWKLYIEESIKY
nr:putative ribonuclease H-like domain-containing protein [Tanacetum cinerariifolium]